MLLPLIVPSIATWLICPNWTFTPNYLPFSRAIYLNILKNIFFKYSGKYFLIGIKSYSNGPGVATSAPDGLAGSASGLAFLGVRARGTPVPWPVPHRMTWAGVHGFLLPTWGTSGLGTRGNRSYRGTRSFRLAWSRRAAFQENFRPLGTSNLLQE